METLIGILLYIGAITINTPYSTTQINDIEAQNHESVVIVENDPNQLNQSIELYNEEGDKVIVFEEEIAW
ncbi:hypothetical protein GC194_02290 [bacterium]|nr:hypothetical protein [bacterium]